MHKPPKGGFLFHNPLHYSHMQYEIDTSILKTLAYFSLFSCPLTRQELFQFFWVDNGKAVSRKDIDSRIDYLVEKKMLEKKHAYLFLPGNEDHVRARMNRSHIIEHKMRIAKRAAKVFKWIPYVRAVFVCNQLQTGITMESDIDVYVVVKKGYLWITRLITTVLMSGFGLRRNKTCVADHICLSFFVTDDAINLHTIKIDGADVYLRYWLMQLIPLYDPYNVHAELLQANRWASSTLPHAAVAWKTADVWSEGNGSFSHRVKRFFEIAWKGAYGTLIESQAKGIQIKKMNMNVGSKQDDTSTDVIITDSMLKFHENDRREQFQNKWKEACAQLISQYDGS